MAGHQPMIDATGMLAVVFNGEIYNHRELRKKLEAAGHRFRSTCDTEVILEGYRAWGTDCLSRFNGMFALGLYDGIRRRLFLARDRVGEKPLFYTRAQGRFLFASELKALLADPSLPRRLDRESLECYLGYGYVPGDMCIVQGMRKLPPAHAMTLDLESGEERIWRYWNLPEPEVDEHVDPEVLVDELIELLRDSVRRQMVADVPVGILLSGGVDSSLVTALAAESSSRPIKTFTITFPGHGVYDEAPYARVVARHFNTDHTELPGGLANMDLLPELARQYDEPIGDSSMIPTSLVSQLIRSHATVAMGGDGGDELFGGYIGYQRCLQVDAIRRRLPGLVRAGAAAVAEWLPIGLRSRDYLAGLGGTTPQSTVRLGMKFDRRSRRRLLTPREDFPERSGVKPETYKLDLYRPGYGLPKSVMGLDFHTYLPEDILVKVDRASMLHSLEVRSPMLDYRLVEFAFRKVPNSLCATKTARKILLRRAAARVLPSELNMERKRGFSLPMRRWFKQGWGRFCEDVLRQCDPDLFDRKVVLGLLAAQRKGFRHLDRLFLLTLFELWRREYRITVA